MREATTHLRSKVEFACKLKDRASDLLRICSLIKSNRPLTANEVSLKTNLHNEQIRLSTLGRSNS